MRETRTSKTKSMIAECSRPILFFQQYAIRYHCMYLISITNSNTMHTIQCMHVYIYIYIRMHVCTVDAGMAGPGYGCDSLSFT